MIRNVQQWAAVARPLVFLSFAVAMGACSDSPTAPSAMPAPNAVPGVSSLSGVVSEMTAAGFMPVEGAKVELRIGFSHFATTDQNGLYSLSGVAAGNGSLSTTKHGYSSDRRTVTVSGDTRLDIQVVRIPTYTLSGVVSEMTPTGSAPVKGVEVYCDSCGENGHTAAYTDASGLYTFSGVFNGVTPLLVRKEGYRVIDPVPAQSGFVNAEVNGDTRFNIQLARGTWDY